MKARHVAFIILLLALLAALRARPATPVVTSRIEYGPPPRQGTVGEVIIWGGQLWGWTEFPGEPGRWVRIEEVIVD